MVKKRLQYGVEHFSPKEDGTMKKLMRLLRRVRIRFRRSTSLTKAVVLSAVALSLVALLTLHFTIRAAEKRAEELAQEAAQLEQENKDLGDKKDGLGSADGIEDIAKDEGMVGENDIIIIPNTGN